MKLKIIFIALFLLITFTLIAIRLMQPAIGPHGGIVREAGQYHIEIRSEYTCLYVFLLDGKTVPIPNRGILCELRVLFPDNTDTRLLLKPYGTDGFFIRLGSQRFQTYKICFNVFGENVSTEFNTENLVVQK